MYVLAITLRDVDPPIWRRLRGTETRLDARLDRHIVKNDAEHARLDRAISVATRRWTSA